MLAFSTNQKQIVEAVQQSITQGQVTDLRSKLKTGATFQAAGLASKTAKEEPKTNSTTSQTKFGAQLRGGAAATAPPPGAQKRAANAAAQPRPARPAATTARGPQAASAKQTTIQPKALLEQTKQNLQKALDVEKKAHDIIKREGDFQISKLQKIRADKHLAYQE